MSEPPGFAGGPSLRRRASLITGTVLVLAATLVGASVLGIVRVTRDENVFGQATTAAAQLPLEGRIPSLGGATAWLNSPPLTPEALRGKVVLVDFWTFTCINWLRTLPYVRAWAEKYKDQGLVVIGVHTPEFSVEKDLESVRRAVKDMNVAYPVAQDNSYGVWNAFRNHYWPATYLIDAEGRIRRHQFGEGGYEEMERAIQELLVDAGASGVDRSLVAVHGTGPEAAPDLANARSPETYVGYDRTDNFASVGGQARDQVRSYAAPARLALNNWALAGLWMVGGEAIKSTDAGARIAYSFHARDLHLVMGAAAPGRPVRFRVTIDGQPPGEAHGSDVDGEGNGIASEIRLYQLVRQPGAIMDRRFDIEFLDPGAEAFSFTFG
jgi:thiol-disulfide isomerase/thioredoxin